VARLLLVDDDISEISAVKRVLSRTGHAPLLATNSSDAITSVGQARPDLILLGATCEAGRALEAICLLDEEEATREIPIIILGEASGAPARAVQLPRPIDPAALAEHVRQFLSSAPAAKPFERRVSSTELPAFLERRSGPSDSALARKAAAEALLARARELRGTVRDPAAGRPARPSTPAPAEAAAGLDALFELEPPAGVGDSSEPVSETPFDLPEVPPLDLSMEEPAARRTVVVPAYEPSEAAAEPEPFQLDAPQPPAAPPPLADSAPTPAPAPSPDWEHDRDEELETRRTLEEELRQLREQLDADRRKHDEELHTVLEQATVREQAALERQASAAEAAASRAVAEAEARFGAALEKLRASASTEAERHPPARPGPRSGKPSRPYVGEPVLAEAPSPFFADVPPPDPAQQAARRRALSRRAPADSAAAGTALPAEPPWALSPPEAPPAELRAGNLDDLPMARLLATALKARAVGRLDVVGDATRALWFEDGHVVGAASNVAGERLDEVALRLGLLTREQHRQVANAAAGLSSRRAAVLLVDRGYLKSGELTSLVRARTEEVVFGIFAEVNARFRWVADPVPFDERISLDRPPLALAVEGVRRRWLAPRLEAILGGPATLVTPVHGGPTADELGLLPDERRALASADGLRTLDEVLAASPLDALSTRQLLAALVLIGVLGVKVVQAGRPAAQVSAGIDLARVKEKLEQVRRADYFTNLGLGRVATPHEVRAAAERLTAEFQAERYRGNQEEGLPARLEEIRRVVADAREVLADPFLREEYERGLQA
jgi:CheY-like chemotaxis protein